MHRRSFLAGLVSVVGVPRAVEAQQRGHIPTVGYCSFTLGRQPGIFAKPSAKGSGSSVM